MLNRFLNDPHNWNSASLIIYSVSRVSGSSQSFQRKIISKGHLCYAIYDKPCKIMCSLFSRFANLHSLWAVPIHVQRPDMLTLTKYRTMNNNHCCVVMWKPINLHMLMRSMPPLEHTTIYISCTSVSYGLQCTTKCNLKLALCFKIIFDISFNDLILKLGEFVFNNAEQNRLNLMLNCFYNSPLFNRIRSGCLTCVQVKQEE